MKKNIFLAVMLTAGTLSAQKVGINTETPKATLDVNAEAVAAHQAGVQAPRLTRAELTAKGDNLYGEDHQGALVYITDVSGGDATGQRIEVLEPGYYLFDGQIWQKLISMSEYENLYMTDGTLTSNRLVTQNAKTLTFTNTTKGGTIFTNTTGTAAAQKAAIQIKDGQQGVGKVLMSDAEGNVNWQLPAAPVLTGTFLDAGRTGEITQVGTSYKTGATITLPRGTWAISIAAEVNIAKPAGATGTASRWGILYLSTRTDDSFTGVSGLAGNANTSFLAAHPLNFIHSRQTLAGSQIITVTGAEQTFNVYFITNEGWGGAADSNFSSTGYKITNSFAGTGKNTYFFAVKLK
ncbi:hypothetical protein BPO_0701 [Bergeyella porcorum]|uniref:T9SS C-terminal target domain-containing protein n=1 Tax=Bergeyella porcorum TaxID=1735111 RepID=A0AAU0EYL5_9FLAO